MDVVASYQVLLAVLSFVLRHAYPVPKSTPNLADTLAGAAGVAADAVRAHEDDIEKLCKELLGASQLELHGARTDDDGDGAAVSGHEKLQSGPRFEDLLHPAVLKRNMLSLNSFYDRLGVDITRLDERYVLNEQLSHLLDTPCRVTTSGRRPTPPEGASRQLTSDYNEHRYRTPTKPKRASPQAGLEATPTPLSSSQSDIKWMCSLDNFEQHPGPALVAAMEACSENPQPTMAQRIDGVFDEFQKSQFARSLEKHSRDARNSTHGTTSGKAETAEAVDGDDENPLGLGFGRGFGLEKGRIVALYYAVLEDMIQSETRRLRSKDHSAILRNDVFHRSLLACCCEVILKPACVIAFTYPDLLGYLGLTSFDFQTTIEPFVRAAPDLPSGLKRHMNDLLDVILLQDAWKDGSPLFSALDEQRESGVWPLSCILEKPRRAPELLERKEESEGEPETKHEATGGRRTRILKTFFSRVLAASAARLYALTRQLALDDLLVDQIWTLLKHCIFEHHGLLRGRHIDTMLLSSIYAVAKITTPSSAKARLTFKKIMGAYKNSAFSSLWLQVVAHVPLGEGQAKRNGNIIEFYNAVFIKSVRTYVLRFQNSAQRARGYQRSTGLPHPGILRSPQRLHKSNLFLAAPGDLNNLAMTPRTRALYAFGESPSKDLQLINRAVNKRPPPLEDYVDSDESAEEQRRNKIARIKRRFPVLDKQQQGHEGS
uniref:Retinoblastoma-associated protein A-box domain-containing protein n=2 Tax=Pinguiococcus pyrenoidosus TaxID=172671 RepID=A0A7R9UDJ7_9STRA|mmetsp:Transcript_4761/g.19054  ORF Transcript_4761/g.19054 Transcript_4761/m.19054 type:complete len:714 (+) Transcript_4761:749-2890(+)